jgi:hypothetical protein
VGPGKHLESGTSPVLVCSAVSLCLHASACWWARYMPARHHSHIMLPCIPVESITQRADALAEIDVVIIRTIIALGFKARAARQQSHLAFRKAADRASRQRRPAHGLLSPLRSYVCPPMYTLQSFTSMQSTFSPAAHRFPTVVTASPLALLGTRPGRTGGAGCANAVRGTRKSSRQPSARRKRIAA